MHEVGRERRRVFTLVHWLCVEIFGNRDLLEYCLNEVLLTDKFVRLDTGHAERTHPLYRLACRSDHFGTLGKPVFDLIGIVEEITDTLDCYLGQVGRCLIQLTICLEKLSFFELLLDLLSGSDEGNTVYGGHHSLLDHFSRDFTLQTFSDFD